MCWNRLIRSMLIVMEIIAALVSQSYWCQTAWAQRLTPLEYGSESAVVDLGVGLWAWPIPCDADNDGDYDLIVSCPDKPSNGVWLFENTSGDTVRNKMPVFAPGRRLSKTVHYVMPSYIDAKAQESNQRPADGANENSTNRSRKTVMRVLSPGKEYREFETHGTDNAVALPVDANFYKPAWQQTKGPKVRHNQWRYVDFDGDDKLDLVVGIEDWSHYGWDDAWNEAGEWQNGPLHGFVLLLRNRGTTESPIYEAPQKVMAEGVPIDVYGCPSPNFGDFDGDGDLDLICGEFLDRFTYFENTGDRAHPVYSQGRFLRDESGDELQMDLEMIVPVAFDWDCDGDLDLIVGDEDGRVALVECIQSGVRGPQFRSPQYFQQRAHQLKCGALATPFGVDFDNDGDTDILSGNTAGYIEYVENLSGPGVEFPKWAIPRKVSTQGKPFRIMAGRNGSVQGPAEAKWGYTTLNVADWDNDGYQDIIFNSILGRVQWLRNIGSHASSLEFEGPHAIEVDWSAEAPKPKWTWWKPTGKELVTQWRTTPVVRDFTGDGLLDLAMLDSEGYLVLFERKSLDGNLHLSAPKRCFVDRAGLPLRLTNGEGGRSGRRKLAVVDWNGDGELDWLMNSANADLYVGLGQENGVWRFESKGALAEQNIEGHDVSPTVVDFDGNGVPDFLGGAEDGRFYYLRNPRSK